MPGDRDAEVDPRFDPVFQRGYDPNLHGGRRQHSEARHGTAPTPTPTASIRELTTPERDAVAPAPPDGSALERDASDTLQTDLDEHEARGLNPFRLTLLIGSVAAIGGAGLLVWHRLTSDPYGSPFTTDLWALFWQQMGDTLLVPLLTGGLIGLAVWLGLLAVSPRWIRHE